MNSNAFHSVLFTAHLSRNLGTLTKIPLIELRSNQAPVKSQTHWLVKWQKQLCGVIPAVSQTRVRIQPHRHGHTQPTHRPPAFCELHFQQPSSWNAKLVNLQTIWEQGKVMCQQLRRYTDHTYKCPAWKERQGWWTHIKTEIILNDTINNLFLWNFQKNGFYIKFTQLDLNLYFITEPQH